MKSSDQETEKKKQYFTKKLFYYISHMNPGGIEPLTFWEKVKIIGFLLLLMGVSLGLFLLLVFSYVFKK